MRILLNLATLKKGGGQNVALNFLECLDRQELNDFDFVFVVVRGSALHEYLLKKHAMKIILMPSNPIFRMIREFILGGGILRRNKINIIYTYFGIGLYPKFIPQVSGSADSNIYFPEINFWSEYKGIKRGSRKVIDAYRKWGLKRVDAIIFENKSMQSNCEKLFGITQTIFIKPSINTNYPDQKYNLPLIAKRSKYVGLFFCGWQRNKNFMLIPYLAEELKKNGIDFHFVLTAQNDNSEDHILIQDLSKKLGVERQISVVGPVNKSEIKSLYEQIDFVFLLSKLESFSNNIIEAWNFKKPLLISDDLWSRSICNKAAVYVARNDVKNIVSSIEKLIGDRNFYNSIIENGKHEISTYPSIDEKTIQELNFIRKVYENH